MTFNIKILPSKRRAQAIVKLGMAFLVGLMLLSFLMPSMSVIRMTDDLTDSESNMLVRAYKETRENSNDVMSKLYDVTSSLMPFSWNVVEEENVVPNIVHFIYLSSNETSELNLNFRDFIAVYSAYFHLNPEIIFIHTNLPPPELIKLSKWAQILMDNVPCIQFHQVHPPSSTKFGERIKFLANQSDFVRVAVLYEFGGIYLDFDSFILRDLRPLRYSGFKNVFGKQGNGQIGAGLILAEKESFVMSLFICLMDEAYDGGWDTHIIDLADRIIASIAPLNSYEVLLLDRDAFFPLTWKPKDLMQIYASIPESINATTSTQEIEVTFEDEQEQDELAMNESDRKKYRSDIGAFVGSIAQEERRKLAIEFFKSFPGVHASNNVGTVDFRLSWAIHGFNNAFISHNAKTGELQDAINMNVTYILSRSSNFALAVYPAVKHAFDSGMLD